MSEHPVILVADDSVTVRAALRHHLVEQGYSVIEAEDGLQALTTIREQVPDVVLLDVEMPVLDGHAVLEVMHNETALSHIPVVFLTARTDAAEVVAGLKAGAHDYLRKPFEAAELVARVSAAVRVKHLQDELRRRYDELNQLSRLDALTGLFNRGHAEERLRDLCSASGRHHFPVSVLLVDLDHFKKINDTYGHPAGDAVLREAAECLLRHQRVEDVPARWGGEELLLVLPYTDEDGAVAVANRLRAEIDSLRTSVEGAPIRVTASIGICTGVALSPEGLISRADQALYRAKAEGRNRVVVAHHA